MEPQSEVHTEYHRGETQQSGYYPVEDPCHGETPLETQAAQANRKYEKLETRNQQLPPQQHAGDTDHRVPRRCQARHGRRRFGKVAAEKYD